jgi:DMSO/TMAO reductase YedYZ heme-binding membrane subunit
MKKLNEAILAFGLCLSFGIFLYSLRFVSSDLQGKFLSQVYGVVGLAYLYITLLIGPVIRLFHITMHGHLLKARREIGISTCYFSLLHAVIAFISLVGGFSGLEHAPAKNLIAAYLGFIGLMILFFMAITSSDIAVKAMTFSRWKFLHRFVYIGGTAILCHAFLRGTHFQRPDTILPLFVFFALTILLVLEAVCTYQLLVKIIKGH